MPTPRNAKREAEAIGALVAELMEILMQLSEAVALVVKSQADQTAATTGLVNQVNAVLPLLKAAPGVDPSLIQNLSDAASASGASATALNAATNSLVEAATATLEPQPLS